MNKALLPPEIELLIPPLYSTEETSARDKIVVVKYFSPYSGWTWFATEGSWDTGDFIFFGLVYGLEKEWGYFSLSELGGANKGDIPLVERDLYFKPVKLSEIEAKYDRIYKIR